MIVTSITIELRCQSYPPRRAQELLCKLRTMNLSYLTTSLSLKLVFQLIPWVFCTLYTCNFASKFSRLLCLPYSVTGVDVVSSLPSNFPCSWCSILLDKLYPATNTASIGDDEIVILLAISAVFALTETHSLFMYNHQGFWTIILVLVLP